MTLSRQFFRSINKWLLNGQESTFTAAAPKKDGKLRVIFGGVPTITAGSFQDLGSYTKSYLAMITDPTEGREISRELLGGDRIAGLLHAIYGDGMFSSVYFFTMDADGNQLAAVYASTDTVDRNQIRFFLCK